MVIYVFYLLVDLFFLDLLRLFDELLERVSKRDIKIERERESKRAREVLCLSLGILLLYLLCLSLER